MRHLVLVLGSFMMVSCGPSEAQYQDRVAEVSCAKWEECLSPDIFSADDYCPPPQSTTGAIVCDYDAGVAQQCIDEIAAAECDEETGQWDQPEVCAGVYTNCH